MPNEEKKIESQEVVNSQSMSGEPASTPASNEDLIALQDQMFGGKKEREVEVKKDEGKTSAPEKPKGDTAQKIFERTKQVSTEAREKASQTSSTKKEDTDFPFDDEASVPEVKSQEVDSSSVDLDKENNIKNLRQLAGNFKNEVSTLRAKVASLEAELQTKPEISAIQNENAQLKERIKQLEPWELVYSLENSPIYKQQFVEPLNGIIAEAKQIAKDYGVDENIAMSALSSTNRRDLDELLENGFTSQSAIADLKTLKQRYDGIQRKRSEFAQKPQEALAKFEEERARIEAQKKEHRGLHLKQITQEGWSAALGQNSSLPRKEKIWELAEIPGKKEHNEKIVKPALAEANKMLQMGLGYVESLVSNQMLPSKEFAQWFASICQQAAATQTINQSRWHYYEALQEQTNSQKKAEKIKHPEISSSNGRAAPTKPSGERKDGKARAADIFSEVMNETAA